MKALAGFLSGFATARRFLPDLRPHVGRLSFVGALSVALVGLELAAPWPIKWIFDEALDPVGEPRFELSTIIAAGAGAAILIGLLHALSQYGRDLMLADVAHRVTRGLRYRIFAHLARLSPLFHARHKSGDLLVRLMGDVPMVTAMTVESTTELVTRTLLLLSTAGFMLWMDPVLALIVLAALPLVALVVTWISKSIKIAVRKQRSKEGDLADYLHEAIAATETIQALGGSDHVVRRFARGNRTSERAGLKAKRLAARMGASVELLMTVAIALVLLVGSLRVVNDVLTTGELLVFLDYVRRLLRPLRSASKQAERFAKGSACGERILAILDEAPAVTSLPGAPSAPEDPRELAFADVHFAYADAGEALAGFDASFHKGELAALVGRSGAGKSTAAALALRLFDPQAGSVTLDGRALASFDLASLRERIGLVQQQSVLFGDSIRENLLLGRPQASDEDLWRALRDAGAEEFVRALPDSLDAELGSSGIGLSGGERRRLTVARTLVRGARVVIVDEPFAGLDKLGVEQVRATLTSLARDRIVVVIAHDAGDLTLFDRVVFVDRGRVLAEGTHDALVAGVPLYRSVMRQGAEVRG